MSLIKTSPYIRNTQHSNKSMTSLLSVLLCPCPRDRAYILFNDYRVTFNVLVESCQLSFPSSQLLNVVGFFFISSLIGEVGMTWWLFLACSWVDWANSDCPSMKMKTGKMRSCPVWMHLIALLLCAMKMLSPSEASLSICLAHLWPLQSVYICQCVYICRTWFDFEMLLLLHTRYQNPIT